MNALTNYGLTKRETRVYLVCLEFGIATAQKISKSTGFPRSTCYEVLQKLQKKNLVSIVKKSNILTFTATDPRLLANRAQATANSITEMLPNLLALYHQPNNRVAVRFYEGSEGMKIILEEILKEAAMLYSLGSADHLFDILDEYGYLTKFVERRVRKKIPMRGILIDSEKARERQRIAEKKLMDIKIMPPSNDQGFLFFWKHKIALFDFTDEYQAIIVESKELTKLQITIFNTLWNLLP